MGNVGVNLSSTNADTLDGKHASDFVQRYSALLPVDYVSNPAMDTDYKGVIDSDTANSIGLDGSGSCWWHIIGLRNSNDDGYGSQLAIPLYPNNSNQQPKYRTSIGSTFQSWKNLSDGGNAAGLIDPLDSSRILNVSYQASALTGMDVKYILVFDPSNASNIRCVHIDTLIKLLSECRSPSLVEDRGSASGMTSDELNASAATNGYEVCTDRTNVNLECVDGLSTWIHLKHFAHSHGNGYASQLAIPFEHPAMYLRSSSGTTWADWVAVTTDYGENLIDNPDFKINQRGFTTYCGYGGAESSDTTKYNASYTVDRWKLLYSNEKLVVNSDYVELTVVDNQGIGQVVAPEVFRPMANAILTFSAEIEVTSGFFILSIFSSSGNVTSKEVSADSGKTRVAVSKVIFTTTSYLYVNITGNGTCKIYNTKLEVGTIATKFYPPNPIHEMIKCKRFYQRIDKLRCPIAHMSESSRLGSWIYTSPYPMRVNPSSTVLGSAIICDDTSQTPIDISVAWAESHEMGTVVRINGTVPSTVTVNSTSNMLLQLDTTGGKYGIELSADL